MHRRTLVPFLLVLLVSGGLAACDDGDGDETLTVYSGRDQELIAPLLEQFSEETGIDVEVRYGDSPDMALLIDEEGDRTPADVFVSQSPGAAGFLSLRDHLETIPDEILDQVPADFRGRDGDWVGLTGRVRTLVYHTELVEESDLPDSVLEVTDEEYGGRFGVAPENASFQDFVSALREDLGDDATLEWLEGLVDNDVQTYANNTAIVEAVSRGEIEFGLVNHYYNARILLDDPSAVTQNYFFADGDIGSTILVTTASIVEGTGARDEAVELLDFLVSTSAQQYFAEETAEYPLSGGVAPVGDLPPLESIAAPPVDLAALGADLEATKELMEQSGLEER